MRQLTVIFTDSEGNKKGKKRSIIYPTFYLMAEECEDAFWKYKLMEFSVGKMPIRYRYIPQSRMLTFKKRTRDFTVEFTTSTDDPAVHRTAERSEGQSGSLTAVENIERFKDFMRSTTGVISPTEIQEELPDIDSPREKKTWTQIMKSKNLSLHYISEYCKEVKRELRLDAIAYNSLLYAVDDLRLNGTISKCVSFDGDEITHIGNLYQDDETGYFHVIPEKTRKTVTNRKAVKGTGGARGDIWERVSSLWTARLV